MDSTQFYTSDWRAAWLMRTPWHYSQQKGWQRCYQKSIETIDQGIFPN
jgi:hypothetical protein